MIPTRQRLEFAAAFDAPVVTLGGMKSTFALATLLVLAACSSSDDTAKNSTTANTTFTIAPPTANVGTCRTQELTATPSDGVTWTLEGAGSIADGLYTAPLSVPSPSTATVKATRQTQSATASITLATAFPGTPVDLARTAGNTYGDFVHAYAASGGRAYALTGGATANGLSKSTDGGVTWGAPVSLPVGDGYASAVAIDAGNPDVVYVTVHRGDENASSILELAKSTDGGATFTTKPLYSGGNGDVARPDVVSPAPNHVVVSAPAPWQDSTLGQQGIVNLVFHDGAGGSFPAATLFDNGYKASSVPLADQTPRTNGMLIETNTGRFGPHLATNGAGKVCVTYAEYDINGVVPENHWVKCSSDGGATWGQPVSAVTGRSQDLARPRIAVSKDGQVVVVTYSKFADSSLDELGQTAFKVSIDGGATWGAEKVQADVPDPAADGAKLAVSSPEVLVDAAGVIWFARQIGNGLRLQVDKSCDKGATLSGAVDLPITTPIYNPALFETSAGLFGGGSRGGAADTGPTAVLLLAP